MKKAKALTLLTIVCILLAFLFAMTVVSFPAGIHDYNSILKAIELDYDIEGGTVYNVSLANDNRDDIEDINSVLKTLGSRLNALGYGNYSLSAVKDTADGVKDYSVRVGVKTSNELANDIDAVFAYGSIKFYGDTSSTPTTEIMNEGEAIKSCTYAGEGEGRYYVALKFTDYGYNALTSAIDSSSESFYLKISLGDKDVFPASQITTNGITDKTIYITSDSEENAKRLILQISTGGLPYKFDVENAVSYEVDGAFGKNTDLCILVSVISLIVVACIYFIIKYKGYGFAASLSLLFFILVETAMLVAVPNITLSFGSVIGIILATVLACDGLMIIAKRIKEEYMLGKTVKASISTGFKRSLFPILNTNVFAGLIAISVLAFATGYLKAFAITFGIGVVVSFITSMVIVRMFVSLLLPISIDQNKFLKFNREGK